MYCEKCGEPMQWRCTNTNTNVAKYKCPYCGNVQTTIEECKPVPIEVREPRYYYKHQGRFIVRRMVNGKHRYIGCFGDEETAQKVVAKMYEYGWDKSQLPKVFRELNIEKVNRSWVCV
ncbi:MAG: hypothetical protein J6Y78_06810 [Paludibacteraceae bacterium]|nr:hypothetical protein [Paludibacteraceae bacterium]